MKCKQNGKFIFIKVQQFDVVCLCSDNVITAILKAKNFKKSLLYAVL